MELLLDDEETGLVSCIMQPSVSTMTVLTVLTVGYRAPRRPYVSHLHQGRVLEGRYGVLPLLCLQSTDLCSRTLAHTARAETELNHRLVSDYLLALCEFLIRYDISRPYIPSDSSVCIVPCN